MHLRDAVGILSVWMVFDYALIYSIMICNQLVLICMFFLVVCRHYLLLYLHVVCEVHRTH